MSEIAVLPEIIFLRSCLTCAFKIQCVNLFSFQEGKFPLSFKRIFR